jgi:hypothetical protein
MAETEVIQQPYITDKDGILTALRLMEPEVFNRQVNVGLYLFNWCRGSLLPGQNPYSIELFEDNETNKEMWKRILEDLGLSKTHIFEIKQYLKNGTKQFHPDGRPMMLVFIKPINPSGGGKKSSTKGGGHKPPTKGGGHKPPTKGDEEKKPVK